MLTFNKSMAIVMYTVFGSPCHSLADMRLTDLVKERRVFNPILNIVHINPSNFEVIPK